jgi:hypothetical protein
MGKAITDWPAGIIREAVRIEFQPWVFCVSWMSNKLTLPDDSALPPFGLVRATVPPPFGIPGAPGDRLQVV